MALQTREQHIRREKATSNICTAQVLLAVIAAMYAVYHGPRGLRRIGERVHSLAAALADGLRKMGHEVVHESFFDTVRVRPSNGAAAVLDAALAQRMNLRRFSDDTVGISLDETTSASDLSDLLAAFNDGSPVDFDVAALLRSTTASYPGSLARSSEYLAHPVFNTHHSESEMLRYLRRLESGISPSPPR
jgi:glycine dehydrogenase